MKTKRKKELASKILQSVHSKNYKLLYIISDDWKKNKKELEIFRDGFCYKMFFDIIHDLTKSDEIKRDEYIDMVNLIGYLTGCYVTILETKSTRQLIDNYYYQGGKTDETRNDKVN